ncbi:MAG: hypothetical protein ACTSRS_18695 [Candidatus Helarchaeota archaeon]
MGTIKSFKKVLREYGFYMVKNGKGIQFIKHDAKLGGVYADVGSETIITVQDTDFSRSFNNRKELQSFLRDLEHNLSFMSHDLVRILERDKIKTLLEKIVPQN